MLHPLLLDLLVFILSALPAVTPLWRRLGPFLALFRDLLSLGSAAAEMDLRAACDDDAAAWFRVKNGKQQGCDWVAKKPRKRCKKTGADGAEAMDACFQVCACD